MTRRADYIIVVSTALKQHDTEETTCYFVSRRVFAA